MALTEALYEMSSAAKLLTDLELAETKLFRVLKPILILNLRFCSDEIRFILCICVNKIMLFSFIVLLL